MVKLIYFARLVEQVETAAEDIRLPPSVRDVAGLLAWQAARGPEWRAAFADPRAVQVMVNKRPAGLDHPVADGDQIAFVPVRR